MAAREGGHDQGGARSLEERAGGGGDAVRTLRSQRGLAAAGGTDLQSAERAEAAGPACGAAECSTEAATVPDLQHGGPDPSSRAQRDLPAETSGANGGGMENGVGGAAAAASGVSLGFLTEIGRAHV